MQKEYEKEKPHLGADVEKGKGPGVQGYMVSWDQPRLLKTLSFFLRFIYSTENPVSKNQKYRDQKTKTLTLHNWGMDSMSSYQL